MGNKIPFDKILQVTTLASEKIVVPLEKELTQNQENNIDDEGEDTTENQLALF